MINAKNLPKTCGQCHPGAGTRFAISQVHVAEGATEPAALRWVREFYLLLIPVTIGLMLLHNGGDWVRKLLRAALLARSVRAAVSARRRRGNTTSACCPSSASSTPVLVHFVPDAGVDRLRPEISRPVVGAPAARDGRRALHAQPDPPRRRGDLHGGFASRT